MSRRKLVQDPIEERRKAYQQMPAETLQEALWEALDALHQAGLDIGPKAKAVLVAREKVKGEKVKRPQPKK